MPLRFGPRHHGQSDGATRIASASEPCSGSLAGATEVADRSSQVNATARRRRGMNRSLPYTVGFQVDRELVHAAGRVVLAAGIGDGIVAADEPVLADRHTQEAR